MYIDPKGGGDFCRGWGGGMVQEEDGGNFAIWFSLAVSENNLPIGCAHKSVRESHYYPNHIGTHNLIPTFSSTFIHSRRTHYYRTGNFAKTFRLTMNVKLQYLIVHYVLFS